MAYIPKEWICGEVITADGLNNLEAGVQEALECCGGGDAGYECIESTTLLTNETVTTVENDGHNGAVLAYSSLIETDTLKVTFNGVEYTCPNITVVDGEGLYGAPYDSESGNTDWSEYPFIIASCQVDGVTTNYIETQSAGTYTVKIEALSTTAEVTECFQMAVEKIVSPSVIIDVDASTEASTSASLKSIDLDAITAFANGQTPYIYGVARVKDGDYVRILPLNVVLLNEYYSTCELQFNSIRHSFSNSHVANVFSDCLSATINTNNGSLVEHTYDGAEIYYHS